MTADPPGQPASPEPPLTAGGWQIAPAFAARQAPPQHFYAVYEGGAFGHPERGILAAVACGHAADNAAEGAGISAQLVIHSLAEGYFGARRTLGPKRAVQAALVSINHWLHGQIRAEGGRRLAPVSLTALLFHRGGVGALQVGTGSAYRCRSGQVMPLLAGHLRPGPGAAMPARAIGQDLELSIDYDETEAAAGDRFLLENGLDLFHPELLIAAFRLQLAAPGGSAILLEVVEAPEAAPRLPDLSGLPLRPEPREGEVWDGFVIGKTLYRGRYTVLKHCRDTLEDREVVLKIPLRAMLQDEIFSAGFLREAWIGCAVRGNNVTRYLDLPPERRSSLYLVMPYYRGETLERRLSRPPPISLPDGVGIALKLCEAVQDLAAIEVVHRDLKPENILLLPDNSLKLLDLGLAYLPGIDLRDAARPGGTLRYMAPELLKGVQANPRTEVYALAVTFYRMFAGGAYPFGQREDVPLRRLRPDLPSWLGGVIARGLHADPAARFADAGKMAEALHEGLVMGHGDEASLRRLPTQLQIWQALALGFALAFFLLLARRWR